MSDKEIAAELTKAYMQAYISGVLADDKTILSGKIREIQTDRFVNVYKKFYDTLSSIPEEK